MGPVSVPRHSAVGVALPVAVEDQMQMVHASGQHQGMNGVGLMAVAVHWAGVDKADGNPWLKVVVG